jgi:hypothetical protein
MSPLTSSITAVLIDLLHDLYRHRADRVGIEICLEQYLTHHKANFKECVTCWRYDQDKFVIEFKTIDSDRFSVVFKVFDYLSGRSPKVDPVDDYDRAMRGI